MFFSSSPSKYVRDELVRHLLLVIIPVLAVLCSATGVVPEGSIEEQDRQEDHVEVRHDVCEQGRGSPKKGPQDLRDVVKVPCDAPPAGEKQERGLGLPFSCLVPCCDELGLLSPHLGFAGGCSEYLALLVGSPVDVDAQDSQAEDRGSNGKRQVDWVLNQVKHRRGVDAWHPNEASPAYVESCPVVRNVHGAEVARLPQEELEDINIREHHADQHRVRDLPRGLQLLDHEAKGKHRPAHETHPAVGPLLDVKALPDSRVKLSAPEVVEQEASGASGIRAAWEVVALQGEKEAQDVSEDVESVQHLAKLVVHPGRVEDRILPGQEEGHEGHEVALDPVRLVHRPVAFGRDGPNESFPWHSQLDKGLERTKGGNVSCSLPRQGG